MSDHKDENINVVQALVEDIDKGTALLESFPELVEARNAAGLTPLMEVSILGNVEIAEVLLQKGAVVNALSDKERRTAMHFAAEYGQIDTYCMLKDAGGDDALPDVKRDTPRNVLDWFFSPVGAAIRAAREKQRAGEVPPV